MQTELGEKNLLVLVPTYFLPFQSPSFTNSPAPLTLHTQVFFSLLSAGFCGRSYEVGIIN